MVREATDRQCPVQGDMSMTIKVGATAVAIATCLPGIVVLQALTIHQTQGASRSTRDGVFSAAQLTRGETVYQLECARCHAPNLSGGESSPALTGSEFMMTYEGLTVNDLFERVRTSMPQESPGRLSRHQYVDVVAFVLGKNGHPTGLDDLSPDATALRQVRIEPLKIATPTGQ